MDTGLTTTLKKSTLMTDPVFTEHFRMWRPGKLLHSTDNDPGSTSCDKFGSDISDSYELSSRHSVYLVTSEESIVILNLISLSLFEKTNNFVKVPIFGT